LKDIYITIIPSKLQEALHKYLPQFLTRSASRAALPQAASEQSGSEQGAAVRLTADS
jgi:hypothetical protein